MSILDHLDARAKTEINGWVFQQAADRIRELEARVKELEAERDKAIELSKSRTITKLYEKALEELAALRKGEPVAVVNKLLAGGIKWLRDEPPQNTKLYLAPVIPDGWKLVKEPDELGYGRLVVGGKYYGLPMEVINWLATAQGEKE